MSTRKYTLIILIGLFILSVFGGTFVYFYSKKVRNTNPLLSIPNDVVALVRLNKPDTFINSDSSSTLFRPFESPALKGLLESLDSNSDFSDVLSSSILVSFHPIGKGTLEPLVIISSKEEFTDRKFVRILESLGKTVTTFEYNGHSMHKLQFGTKPLYVFHSVGLTVVSPSLILCESSFRRLDSQDVVDDDLVQAYNLTSSSSDASLALNMSAAVPWLKSNMFAPELQLAEVAADLCKWLIADYQQGDGEISLSGMLTTSDETIAGNSLLNAQVDDMITPSLLTENTAFCLERNLGDISGFLHRLSEHDSVKVTLQGVVSKINPRKAIIEHLSDHQTDSSGFVAVLYPSKADSLFYRVKLAMRETTLEQNVISELSVDSSSVSLSKLLGMAFKPVVPKYILVDSEKVVFAENARIIRLFINNQSVLSMRNDKVVSDIWENKITSKGIAALYLNPNFSSALVNSIFGGLFKKEMNSGTYKSWNGLGLMLTSNGTNLLFSGYIGKRAPVEKVARAALALKPDATKPRYINLPDGRSLIALWQNDSLLVVNAKLEKMWRLKMKEKPDTLFVASFSNKNYIGVIANNALQFYTERGTRASDFKFDKPIAIVASSATKDASKVVVVDKKGGTYALQPQRSGSLERLFKIKKIPANIVYAKFRGKEYLLAGSDKRTNVLDIKGNVVKRIAFDLNRSKALVFDNKMLFFSSNKSLVLNERFVSQKDAMLKQLEGTNDIWTTKSGDKLVLVKDESIWLSTDRTGSKYNELKLSFSPLRVRPNGVGNGILVVDENGNLYAFDANGILYPGYPRSLPVTSAIATMADGSFFAVSEEGHTLVSRQIIRKIPPIL